MSVCVVNHPLVQHKLTILRDISTGAKEFRELVNEIATLICYEASRNFPLIDKEVQTPLAATVGKELAGRKIALVPILRAGLGMVDGVLHLIPAAKVGHIGLYRDHDTCMPVEYFCKLPTDIGERDVLLLDPMLATGGSAIDAISQLKKRGVKHIKLLCIIAAQHGVDRLLAAYPDVEIFCGAIDERLDENSYIVPGLGDAGDRIFGTK